jgi:hypothetical protein
MEWASWRGCGGVWEGGDGECGAGVERTGMCWEGTWHVLRGGRGLVEAGRKMDKKGRWPVWCDLV